MKLARAVLFALIGWLWSMSIHASTLELVDINEQVKAIVGELSNRSAENLGNNATFGFIMTEEGVILIDSGGSHQGAKAIHDLIKTTTKQPIKYVINTGGQDHRWFGNDYFQQLGAKVISAQAAREDHETRREQQMQSMRQLIGEDALANTKPSVADITFDKEYELSLGGVTLKLYHYGQAHTPGDLVVWLPKEQIVFSGDIVYLGRMLGVGKQSNAQSWISAFQAMEALEPKVIIPGHGKPATLAKAKQSTYEYLAFLLKSVTEFMDNDGVMEDLRTIDQSQFSYLKNFDSLSGRNIQNVYMELEF